ncbi:hypothetical protein M0R45_017363 [Rubus argutus]|uniref:Uncharacterized protein n=1 Tax=Rubus argutus TaxID=59490 RepID=A0AAW1XXB5_RUBAR
MAWDDGAAATVDRRAEETATVQLEQAVGFTGRWQWRRRRAAAWCGAQRRRRRAWAEGRKPGGGLRRNGRP